MWKKYFAQDCGRPLQTGQRNDHCCGRELARENKGKGSFGNAARLSFPLSIRDNISCGHEIPEEKLWASCESASLIPWIAGLPKGLDTYVGERGNQVSGGQAQRIQIARAICKDAPIILLDEPVSALDQDTGHSVLQALNKLTEGKTVIHVTHHPETLEDGYVLYRMEGGRLYCE